MTGAAYLGALAYGAAIASIAVLGALGCRRRLVSTWRGSPARLVEAVLAIAIVVLAAELTGLFGGLTKFGLLAGVAAVAAGAYLLSGRFRSRPAGEAIPAPPAPGGLLAVSLVAAAVAVLHWSGGVQDSLAAGIYRQDSAWYHLPLAAGFFQAGDTWSIHFTDPLALTAWFYPLNSELLHAAGMLVTGNDFLSPLVNLGWLALALGAGWCVGRPYGLGPATLVGTALVLDSGMMATQAGNAPSDTAGLFFLLACVAILVNADLTGRGLWDRGASGALAVAALAAGLAIGTKMTLLAPLLALSIGMLVVAPRASRLQVGLIWLGGLLAGGGFWYLRNLVHAGNPLPWIGAGPLPSPDQPALYPRPPHSVLDYLDDPAVWLGEFVPRLERGLGEAWPLVLLAAAAGLLLALRRGRAPLLRLLGAVGVFAALVYVLIPISASGAEGRPSGFETNLRYLAPAIVLGLVLLPFALSRRRAAWLAVCLAGVLVLNAASATGWDVDQLPAGAVFVLALVLAPAGLVALRSRGASAPALAGLAATVLCLLVALGFETQRDYLRSRYVASLAPPADSPGFRATPQWRAVQEWGRGLEGERVGVVGPPAAYGQYVFYGRRLSNRVRYVGAPGPNGAYLPIARCADWFRAVNRGGYDHVVVTPATAVGIDPVPQESIWLSRDPAAREVLRAGAASVFEIERPLDPGRCDPDTLPPVLQIPGGGVGVPGVTLPP